MTLFTVAAHYTGCEYGSLFIVAAKDASEAKDLVRAWLGRIEDVTIEQCDPIGTADSRFNEPQVVDGFAT